MGLSGRKTKQRIADDPRNLSWADDAAKFGTTYLSKFGWDSSRGLGVDGSGRLSHIKVSQKLDMLGIGAAHQKDPNGIAWKQNRDFENLLKRLNGDAVEESGDLQQIFTQAHSDDPQTKEKPEPNHKKRKHKDEDEEKVERKRRRREEKALEATGPSQEKSEKSNAVVSVSNPGPPRHRAHRARAIAAKDIASKSSAAISEILGVSPASIPSIQPPISGSLTSTDENHIMEKLTISTKSVSDYFQERLRAKKSLSSSTVTVLPQNPEAAPRYGIGSSAPTATSPSLSLDLMSSFTTPRKFGTLLGAPQTESDTTSDINNTVTKEVAHRKETAEEKVARRLAKKARKAAKKAAKEGVTS
ncbi:hypothetical protein DL96DRAFT_1709393 [Flagelloscypha sp. PMI_526]|nr:hypothetical protein DL96DRAFT_1709393 [Flagelloscypha sp. PMI_526]